MSDHLKNLIIGLFVLAATAIVVFIIMFLHPKLGNEGELLNVRFVDIDKVNIGTRVLFAGKPVGEVLEIREIEDGRKGPKDSSGHIYVYQLKLGVDSHLVVYDTDEITLRTSGLLGERSVAILPLAPEPGVVAHRVTGKDILYATETGSVEETMKQFKKVSETLCTTLTNATAILEDIRKEEVVKHISAVTQNLSDITLALNKPEEWSNMVDNFETFSNELATRLPPSWDAVDATLNELHAMATNAKETTFQTKTIFTDIGRGQGTIGRLVADEDLYLNTKALLSKVETLADDVNHYGLLFHLDKGWQRLRARRMNLMQKLSTPQEFRNYFNDEVDQISTSLSRLSMILDSTESSWPYCSPYSYIENHNFTKVFAELLRRVETMEESLKMYNEQVMEYEIEKTELTPESCDCYYLPETCSDSW